MCNLMSGLFFRNGDIVSASEYTDSHEVLKRAANAGRASLAGHLAELEPVQWEYTPPADLRLAGDLSKWALKVDQDTTPAWWDAVKVREWCERRVEAMFIREPRGALLGGCWICLGDKATIAELIGGKLAIAVGSSFERSSFLDSRFERSSFVDSSFVGSRFERSRFEDSSFVGSRFVDSSFVGSSFERSRFERSSFVGSRFVDSRFVGSSFVDSSFVGSYACINTILQTKWKRSDESGLIVPAKE